MKYAPFYIPLLILMLFACSAGGGGGGSQGTVAIAADDPVMPPLPISKGIDQQLQINVGPPDASLATWILEPAAGTPIRGTILFMHGFMANHLQLENAADALRHAGYRSVLVDLRGFGLSTGGRITFGVLDAQDMTQLIDTLQAQDLCGPTLGVYGTSYGAAAAILYAAADPRVTTVVAVAPFATIRDEIPSYGRSLLRGAATYLTDEALNGIANVVSNLAHLDIDTARPIDEIAKSNAHILLIHGDADTIIPHASSEKLHAADPDKSELMTIPRRGHLDLCFDLKGELQPATRVWFDRFLPPWPRPLASAKK